MDKLPPIKPSTGVSLPLTPQKPLLPVPASLLKLLQSPVGNNKVTISHSQVLDSQGLKRLERLNPPLAKQVSGSEVKHLIRFTLPDKTLISAVVPIALKAGETVILTPQPQGITISRATPDLPLTQALQQLLRHVIHAPGVSQSLKQLSHLQALPLPVNVLQALPLLKALKSTPIPSFSLKSLATPAQIKEAIKYSGLFTEAALGAAVKDKKPQAKATTLAPDIRTMLGQLHLASTPQTRTTPLVLPTKHEPLLESLLQHFHLPIKAKPQQLTQAINQQLETIIRQLQDSITLNQLRSLPSEQTTQENSSRQLVVEIPLRFGEQIHPLQITIKEYINNEEESTEEKKVNTEHENTKKWQVFLCFDIPISQEHSAAMHAQLLLTGQHLSTFIWSQSSLLHQKAQQHSHHLRQRLDEKGFIIDELLCIHGKPPSASNTQGYLIDIKT